MTFSQKISRWYNAHKRDLPWRESQDPYIIWLSEIILQQTRVEQGLPYFYAFSERFPDVQSLAGASEDEVLRLWQGLGYYSRARNMHHAAKTVMRDFNGVFPASYDSLITLRGVGPYTAAAISSFSVGESKAVVDGNVFRVLARYFGRVTPINSSTGQKEFQQLADRELDQQSPGLHNQAIMEFGALQCLPRNPDCNQCVLQDDCMAFNGDLISVLPFKIRSQKSKDRYFVYFVVQGKQGVLINRRLPNDIWAGLYEFPMFETTLQTFQNPRDDADFMHSFRQHFGTQAILELISRPAKHVLSHQNIFSVFFAVDHDSFQMSEHRLWRFVKLDELVNLAKPKLILSFVEGYFGRISE